MTLAEKEHKKYHKKNEVKQKQIETKLPEWFDKEISKKELSEEEKEEMADLLKEYR